MPTAVLKLLCWQRRRWVGARVGDDEQLAGAGEHVDAIALDAVVVAEHARVGDELDPVALGGGEVEAAAERRVAAELRPDEEDVGQVLEVRHRRRQAAEAPVLREDRDLEKPLLSFDEQCERDAATSGLPSGPSSTRWRNRMAVQRRLVQLLLLPLSY